MPNDIRTQAIVLRRTNYGETDRILNFITPEGKFSALAKGVRKEKSRLAGGIELFSVADIVIHQGRSNLSTLTSAKMLKFYSNILADLTCLEFASECLRKIERISEHTDSPEYFNLLNQSLAALDQKININLVKTWFTLNLAHVSGEEINLLTDTEGNALSPERKYLWDHAESALRPDDIYGRIGAPEIKLARVMIGNKITTIARISNAAELTIALDPIARAFDIFR